MATTEPVCTTSQVIASLATTAALSAVTLVAARAIEKQAQWFLAGGALLSAAGGVLVWKVMAPERVEPPPELEPETVARWIQGRALPELWAERARAREDRDALRARLEELAADHPFLAAQANKVTWFLEDGSEWEQKYKESPATLDRLVEIDANALGAKNTGRFWASYHGYRGGLNLHASDKMQESEWTEEQCDAGFRLLLTDESEKPYMAKVTASTLFKRVQGARREALIGDLASDETFELFGFCLRQGRLDKPAYDKLFERFGQPKHVVALLLADPLNPVIRAQARSFSLNQLVAAIQADDPNRVDSSSRVELAFALATDLNRGEIAALAQALDVEARVRPCLEGTYEWAGLSGDEDGWLPERALEFQLRGQAVDVEIFQWALKDKYFRMEGYCRALGRVWSGQDKQAHAKLMEAVDDPKKKAEQVVAFILGLKNGNRQKEWLDWIKEGDYPTRMAFLKAFGPVTGHGLTDERAGQGDAGGN